MKRATGISLALIVALALAGPAPAPVVEKIDAASVAILTYWSAPAGTADKIVERLRAMQDERFHGLVYYSSVTYGQNNYVAYLGAGTIVKDDYILTVAHLFIPDQESLKGVAPITWVLVKGLDHPIRADVIAQTPETADPLGPDYAVLKLREKLGRSGARISAASVPVGSPVYFSGSVKGTAFFLRSGHSTAIEQFFRKDDTGALHLSRISTVPLLAVYPAGPGDSGGGVFNTEGELVGIMCAGVQIAAEMYVISSPMADLLEFLRAHNLAEAVLP